MPRTEFDSTRYGQPFAFDGWTFGRGAMSGERADRLQLEICGPIDDRSSPATHPPRSREHHVVKNRRGSCDAARVAQLAAIEVADPDTDGDLARVSDRPVVVVRLRRSGFCGDGKREFETAA